MEQEPSEERIVRLMVRELWEHPGEWLSFRMISRLIALPEYDGDFFAGVPEYRFDLFAIAKDKGLKLRPRVVEEVAKKGIESWEIPERPRPGKHGPRGERSFVIADLQSGPCYCHSPNRSVLNDHKTGSVVGEALICGSCWSEICRVCGFYFNSVDPETWEKTCRRRGYILLRQNPRGF